MVPSLSGAVMVEVTALEVVVERGEGPALVQPVVE